MSTSTSSCSSSPFQCIIGDGQSHLWHRREICETCTRPFQFLRRRHHCRTCQRCVVHFDHHCGVFGRCIAGHGLSGNMPFFMTIIVAGYLGAIVTVGAVLGGLFSRLTQDGGWNA